MVTYSVEHSKIVLDHMVISFVHCISSAVVIKSKGYKTHIKTFSLKVGWAQPRLRLSAGFPECMVLVYSVSHERHLSNRGNLSRDDSKTFSYVLGLNVTIEIFCICFIEDGLLLCISCHSLLYLLVLCQVCENEILINGWLTIYCACFWWRRLIFVFQDIGLA